MCVVCGARLLLHVGLFCGSLFMKSSFFFCYGGAIVGIVCGARLLLHVCMFVCLYVFVSLFLCSQVPFCYGFASVRFVRGARLLLHVGLFLCVSFHAVRSLLLWRCKCSYVRFLLLWRCKCLYCVWRTCFCEGLFGGLILWISFVGPFTCLQTCYFWVSLHVKKHVI